MKQPPQKPLSSSLEDYLEAIRDLEEANRVARVKEIAEYLDVKMPSVTGALKVLRQRGLIEYQKNSFVVLTDQGLAIANTISAKHKTLTRFLEQVLLLPSPKAQEMACQLEHSIDCDTISRLHRMMDALARAYDAPAWAKLIEQSGGMNGSGCQDR